MWNELDGNFYENIFKLENYSSFNNLNRKDQIFFKNSLLNLIKPKKFNTKIIYNYNDFLEVNRWIKRSQGSNSPLRLIKYPISNKTNFDFNNEVCWTKSISWTGDWSIKQILELLILS